MRLIRLFGYVLIVVCALSFIATATALATETEAGFLYLGTETGVVTLDGTGGTAILKGSAGSIKCTSIAIAGNSSQLQKHITSGVAVAIFSGCKETKEETKVACRTGTTVEQIETEGIITLFNALDVASKKQLEPGLGFTLDGTLMIKCGAVSIVDVKGTALGLLTETSLTADVTAATAHFQNEGELCDTENTFCKKSQEKANELLVNFTGSFEKAEVEVTVPLTFNKMVLIDD